MTWRSNLRAPVVISIVLMAFVSPSAAKVIYVDDDANGLGDGSNWATAFRCLQDALAVARYGDQIRVAKGVYKPHQCGDSSPTFRLINGVTTKGGYAGFGEPDPNIRDFELYETILSGDVFGNDVDVNDPCDLLTEPTRYENSAHVVTSSNTDSNTILDGFTITGGNADFWGKGGGMYSNSGAATLMNCTFTWNSAELIGGGIYYLNSSSPKLINCTFIANSAMSGGGICDVNSGVILTKCSFSRNSAASSGGGMASIRSMPKLVQCTFSGNSSFWGGAINPDESILTITKCLFNGNSAKHGGVIDNSGSSVTLTNCTLNGNSAIYEGGAVYNQGGYEKPMGVVEGGNLTLSNCTFAGNSAVEGNAIACDSRFQAFPSELKVTNCILWDGSDEIWNNDGSTITVTHSDVQGGWAGLGNVDVDPCFAAPNNDDYHLKSQAGKWDANSQSWMVDDMTSPCIDAGDPMFPIGLEPFPNGGIINMGAYGGTAEASKSYFGKPPCETIVAGDVNGDCIVNFLDFRLMALHWCEDNNP